MTAEAFTVLKEGMEASRDEGKDDAEQRQVTLQESLDQLKKETFDELKKLRTETAEDSTGMRDEFTVAMHALQEGRNSDKQETTEEQETIRREFNEAVEALKTQLVEMQSDTNG